MTSSKAGPGGPAVEHVPEGEFAQVLEVGRSAALRVLEDCGAWADELRASEAVPLPWPLQQRGKGYTQLLRCVATWVADVLMRAFDGHVSPDPADAGFQVILRMVKRATDAADLAMRDEFGGAGRLSGKRDFLNWVKQVQVDQAVASGLPRGEALKNLPISRAAAYRAMKRAKPGR